MYTYFKGLADLFYPPACCVCESKLAGNEKILCTRCRLTLPGTNFHHDETNPVARLFWGRIRFRYATSLLFFEKGSRYRRLIHLLKYQGRDDIGYFIGELLGSAIMPYCETTIDYLVPVPLHRRKLIRMGYNQSECIAKGVSSVTGIPVESNVLLRRISTRTQTRRRRFERWQNVEHVFHCPEPEKIAGKHLLLIDDVVTTGSTLEAAGSAFPESAGILLSCATAGYTTR